MIIDGFTGVYLKKVIDVSVVFGIRTSLLLKHYKHTKKNKTKKIEIQNKIIDK